MLVVFIFLESNWYGIIWGLSLLQYRIVHILFSFPNRFWVDVVHILVLCSSLSFSIYIYVQQVAIVKSIIYKVHLYDKNVLSIYCFTTTSSNKLLVFLCTNPNTIFNDKHFLNLQRKRISSFNYAKSSILW